MSIAYIDGMNYYAAIQEPNQEDAVARSFAIYYKNVLGKDVDDSIINPVDKVEISDEAFRAAQAEAEAKRNAPVEDTTETVGSVTFDRLASGQRTEMLRPGAEEVNDILAEPVTATLSGGSTVTVYGQSYENENGETGTRIMARVNGASGEIHEFGILEDTVISEDENGNITVKESVVGTEQNGTANNDVIISLGGGTINSGDGDDTILVFDIDRNMTIIGGTRVNISTGNGNDTVITGNLYSSKVDMGEGDNAFSAKSLNTGTNITAADGDNSVSIEKSNYVYVTLGNGNNTYVNGEQWATHLKTGNGNNTISIDNLGLGSIRTGSGNDLISIRNALQCSIRTGDGDDTVTIGRINDLPEKSSGQSAMSLQWGEGIGGIAQILSNMVVDLGNGNNTLKLIESADKVTVNGGEKGTTTLVLGAGATLTNEVLNQYVTLKNQES